MLKSEKSAAEESTVQKMYTIQELMTVNTVLLKCKNDKEVKKSSTILSGIRISRKIQQLIKEFYEERDEIFKTFEIPKKINDKGQEYYDFTDHAEKSKIEQSLKEAAETKYEVKGFNEIDADDFVFYTRGLDNDEVVFLYGYLVKEE